MNEFVGTQKENFEKLINNKIYVATYWPNVLEQCNQGDIEFKFANNLLPLPIDQRYSIDDMNKIISIINN